MSNIVRLGVSVDGDLLKKFDRLIEEKGYSNRSEAIRDLMRDSLVQDEWESPDKEVVASITLVYNHHVREIADRLTDLQHHHVTVIISSLHIHLDDHNCLEVLVLRGKGSDVRALGEKLISMRGVRHGRITTTTTGAELT